ncbi:hypothetical protein N0V88_007493 [Collariella sp. IMI 366227]|nr:hypothetical protein N0V88_007493 [Collariella sp. IMI 366227]
MSGHPSWRLLPTAAPGIPTLLVSTAFTADSYAVHLSDLANVWVETLDRRQIIKRGLVEDTSIDPSDGPDQLGKLLELVRAALNSDDPEHENTSLTIARDSDDDSLVLHITCLLPKPLKPFKWPMHLKKCPQSTIASQLVLPMIQAYEARTRKISQLVSALWDKDAVITKLINKLEATGTGLEHVFNALSGKRKVTRAMAEGKVKGLAPFLEPEFRGQAADLRSVAQPSDISALLGSVFGSAGIQYKSDLDFEASTVLNDWWTKLLKGKNIMLSERPEKQTTQPMPRVQELEPRKVEEDDFQVQATPPRARPTLKRPNSAKIVDDDETSDGEDDADGPAPSSPKPKHASKDSASRQGAIGKNRKPHKLGMIGKKAPSPVPDARGSNDTRGRSKTPAATATKMKQVRETSQERADRKRAELQKEMEKRAAAGPAKKKRKF